MRGIGTGALPASTGLSTGIAKFGARSRGLTCAPSISGLAVGRAAPESGRG
jgi:hypothetical protein